VTSCSSCDRRAFVSSEEVGVITRAFANAEAEEADGAEDEVEKEELKDEVVVEVVGEISEGLLEVGTGADEMG
jgi:hypothetical protein